MDAPEDVDLSRFEAPVAEPAPAEEQVPPPAPAGPTRRDPLCFRRKWFRPELNGAICSTLDHPLQGALHCFALVTAIVHHICVIEISRQVSQDSWTVSIWNFEIAASYVYLVVPIFQWGVIAYGVECLPRWAHHMLQLVEALTLMCLVSAFMCTTQWINQATCDHNVRLTCSAFKSISKVCLKTQLAGVVYFALSLYGSRIYGLVRPELRGTWHLATLRGSKFRVRFPWLSVGHLCQILLSSILVSLAALALSLAEWPTILSGCFLFLTYTSSQNLIISSVLLANCCLLPRSPRGRLMGKILEVIAMATAGAATFDAAFWQQEYPCEPSDECALVNRTNRAFIGLQILSGLGHVWMSLMEAYIREENAVSLFRIDLQLGIAIFLGVKYLAILVVSPVLGPIWLYKRFIKSHKQDAGDMPQQPMQEQEQEGPASSNDGSRLSSVTRVESRTKEQLDQNKTDGLQSDLGRKEWSI